MSLNPPLKIALIGAGNRSSTTYAPIFNFVRPWAELVAVCDPVKEHADALVRPPRRASFLFIGRT